ncbi:MAG TPA: hypothetical protein ENN91_00825 [Firmicutes bacterium]|nr:hypothetical protein [Bacillota bacterium]
MNVIEKILQELKEDAEVREVRIGPFWTAVWSRYCGLSSTVYEHEHSAGPPVAEAGKLKKKSALELCSYAGSDSTLERSVALAAVNSLIEVDRSACRNINASELLIKHGRGKKICVVGHFPFVPQLEKAAADLWVLERRPRLNDLPADQAERFLPQADIAAITGTALLNGTMDTLLSLCRKDALIVVLGPTTPLMPAWFEYGVDIISGTRVADPAFVLDMVSQGVIFSQFKGRGVKLLSMANSAYEKTGFDQQG